MAFKRTRTAGPAAQTQFRGFNRYGEAIRSETPIQNQMTSFLDWLARETLAKMLSPADVVACIGSQVVDLHAAISLGSVAQWSRLDRFWQWPCATASRSSEQFLKCMGQERPIWLSDENRWGGLCESAERMHRYECRFEHASVVHDPGAQTAYLVRPDQHQLTCGVHGAVAIRSY